MISRILYYKWKYFYFSIKSWRTKMTANFRRIIVVSRFFFFIHISSRLFWILQHVISKCFCVRNFVLRNELGLDQKIYCFHGWNSGIIILVEAESAIKTCFCWRRATWLHGKFINEIFNVDSCLFVRFSIFSSLLNVFWVKNFDRDLWSFREKEFKITFLQEKFFLTIWCKFSLQL